MFAIATIDDWEPEPGSVVCWHASPASRTKVGRALVSSVPPSYQQAQHLRRYSEHVARGMDMSRLMIFTWDMAGQCDVRAMTYTINAHLRRHDTYRSWFESADGEHFVRHTVQNPNDIAVAPIKHGDMSTAELREHILSPQPLQWDCFVFGIIQESDHFTFYASIAHLCVDPMVMGVLFGEIHMMYGALIAGSAPLSLPTVGSYDDYCISQREYTSSLTVESPEVRAWIDFAAANGGTLPSFPLPLGDLSIPTAGELVTVRLLDGEQTQRFESALTDVGARFSGGVFACAALAHNEITGGETYYGVTPVDTRSTPAELTTTGWFTGLLPVTVPAAATSFDDAARAAQASFDSGVALARVPFDRVVELAPPEAGLGRPKPGNLVMSYLDASIAPLSTVANSDLDFRIHHEGRVSHQVSVWVNRLVHETTMTVLYPNNPVARESVERYIAATKGVYVGVADGKRVRALYNAARS